jgi:hypothetical protein
MQALGDPGQGHDGFFSNALGQFDLAFVAFGAGFQIGFGPMRLFET